MRSKEFRPSQTLAAGSLIAVGIVDGDGFLLRLLFLRGAKNHRKNTNVLANHFGGFQGEKPFVREALVLFLVGTENTINYSNFSTLCQHHFSV